MNLSMEKPLECDWDHFPKD